MDTIDVGYSRRLVGPNLFFNDTGTVLDVEVTTDQDKLVILWQDEVKRIMPVFSSLWFDYKVAYKVYQSGIRLALSAPSDILLAACDVIDFIWSSAIDRFYGGVGKTLHEATESLLPAIQKESNIFYRDLYQKATSLQLNVFREEDVAYIGSGIGRYKVDLNHEGVASIPWQDVFDIPQVIVTGTNGKTTTVRLTHFICQSTGKLTGYASTDWVMIGHDIVDHGDYSGPTGHQFVLTNPKVELAVLESARGGLLKRGLVERHVSAACVTNISADHMSEDGVETLEDLLEAKSIVYQALGEDGYAIINLDDPFLSRKAKTHIGKKIFISHSVLSASAKKLLSSNDHAFFVEGGFFCYQNQTEKKTLIAVQDVPITMKGFAKHNIENALNAMALSFSLGCEFSEITRALMQFENSADLNLGRGNLYQLQSGAKAIVDFAHNPASMEAILSLAKCYMTSSSKLYLMIGTTGNRLNLIDDVSKVICEYQPNKIYIKELKDYLRGAELGEIPQKISNSLVAHGVNNANIQFVDNELAGAEIVLAALCENDVAVLCCHDNIEAVIHTVMKYV